MKRRSKQGTPARTRAGKTAGAVERELRQLLLDKRGALVAKLREDREGRRQASSQPEKIEGTPFGDRPALSPDDELEFAVAHRRAGMLVQIDLALKKMEEGTYGRCEACEEPISIPRLKAQPFAVRCTRCQEAWERAESRAQGGARGREPSARDVSDEGP
jgi:DnaK suppressor protein